MNYSAIFIIEFEKLAVFMNGRKRLLQDTHEIVLGSDGRLFDELPLNTLRSEINAMP